MSAFNRITKATISLQDDANGVIQDQTTSGAADLDLDGDLVTSGVATFTTAQKLSVEGSGNNNGVTLTITGKNQDAVPATEDLTLSNGGTVHSAGFWLEISNLAVDGAVTGNIEAGPLKAQGAVTATLAPNNDRFISRSSIGVTVTGTLTYSVEMTNEDIPSPTVPTWFAHDVLAGKTANDNDKLDVPVSGIRGIITAYTSGTISVVLLQERK